MFTEHPRATPTPFKTISLTQVRLYRTFYNTDCSIYFLSKHAVRDYQFFFLNALKKMESLVKKALVGPRKFSNLN